MAALQMLESVSQADAEQWYLVDFVFEDDDTTICRADLVNCMAAKQLFGGVDSKQTLVDIAMYTSSMAFIADPLVQGFLDSLWNQPCVEPEHIIEDNPKNWERRSILFKFLMFKSCAVKFYIRVGV
jgi:hypothetical protein